MEPEPSFPAILPPAWGGPALATAVAVTVRGLQKGQLHLSVYVLSVPGSSSLKENIVDGGWQTNGVALLVNFLETDQPAPEKWRQPECAAVGFGHKRPGPHPVVLPNLRDADIGQPAHRKPAPGRPLPPPLSDDQRLFFRQRRKGLDKSDLVSRLGSHMMVSSPHWAVCA